MNQAKAPGEQCNHGGATTTGPTPPSYLSKLGGGGGGGWGAVWGGGGQPEGVWGGGGFSRWGRGAVPKVGGPARHPRDLLERGGGGRGSRGGSPPPAGMKIKASPCRHPLLPHAYLQGGCVSGGLEP